MDQCRPLDIWKILEREILIKHTLKQFSCFCSGISSALPQARQYPILKEVISHQQRAIQSAAEMFGDMGSIKLLLFLLFRYDRENSAHKLAIRMNRGFHSNEVGGEAIKIETIRELQDVVEGLKSTEDALLGHIEKLRSDNAEKGIQIIGLRNQKNALQLDYKEKMCNVLLQLNDCINSLNRKSDLEQLQQELQIAKCERKQKDQTIKQLKKKLASLANTVDYVRDEHAGAERQLQSVKEQHKTIVSKLKEKISSLQIQLKAQMESQQSKLPYLIAFSDRHIKQTLTSNKVIDTKEDFSDYLIFTQRLLLKSSEILARSLPMRYFLAQQIESHAQREIKYTSLMYKYDSNCLTFGDQISNSPLPFVVLFKLGNGRVCGGYCPGLCQSQQYESFLFTYLGTGKVFNRSREYIAATGCSFSHNNLRFGSDELVVASRSNQQFKLGANIFGSKCYNIPKTSDFLEGEYQDNRIPFEYMEIHAIYF